MLAWLNHRLLKRFLSNDRSREPANPVHTTRNNPTFHACLSPTILTTRHVSEGRTRENVASDVNLCLTYVSRWDGALQNQSLCLSREFSVGNSCAVGTVIQSPQVRSPPSPLGEFPSAVA